MILDYPGGPRYSHKSPPKRAAGDLAADLAAEGVVTKEARGTSCERGLMSQGELAAPRSWKRHGNGFSSETSRATLISDS